MQYYAECHLGLHSLQKYLFRGFLGKKGYGVEVDKGAIV